MTEPDSASTSTPCAVRLDHRQVGAHGVTGKLGTIKRSDGATQATYDGHRLYT